MGALVTCPHCGANNSADRALCAACGTALSGGQSSKAAGGVRAQDKSAQTSDQGRYIGRMISQRYRVVERLARGGMGEVYVAEHVEMRQLVAVKFLNKRYADDAAFAARFFNEARYSSKITHPNAVTTYDFGRLEDGTLFIVMEYVRGESLRRVVRSHGIIPVEMTVHLASQVAEVLASAHEKKIIHRDVKPDNIMLVPTPGDRVSVKVLDFGIAKILDDESGSQTEPGVMFGTPEYMSPEQARGDDYDHRVDIYALGLLMYYMLAGRPPFKNKNKMAVLKAQADTAPEPIEHLSKQPLPRRLIALIDRMLAKSPADRPATMVEVLEELDAVLSNDELDPEILSTGSLPIHVPPEPHGLSHATGEATAASYPARGPSPLAHGRVRRGEAYAPMRRKDEEHPLRAVSQTDDEGYSFTGVDHRVPPLTLSHTSTSQIQTGARQRAWVLYALIAACVLIVLFAARWTMVHYAREGAVAGADATQDVANKEGDTVANDAADASPEAQRPDAENPGDVAEEKAGVTRHAANLERAKKALSNGDLSSMRSALSAIPTTDRPKGFSELRAQYLRATSLQRTLDDALDHHNCDDAANAAQKLHTEFQENLAAPYRGRIGACQKAADAAKAPEPAPRRPSPSPAPSKPAAQKPSAGTSPSKKPAPSASKARGQKAAPEPSSPSKGTASKPTHSAPQALPTDVPSDSKSTHGTDKTDEPTSAQEAGSALPPMEL